MPTPRLSPVRFLIAALASATAILWAPYVGEFRAAIRTAFSARYADLIDGTIATIVGVVLALAVMRIRDRRWGRYAALAAAVMLGTAYVVVASTGDAEVDAVERFHFIVYGMVTLLFYRAWRPLEDASIFLLSALAALLVGTLDEWFQWFIPTRVGEIHDVLLNGSAIVCGLLLSVGIDPPPTFTTRMRAGSLTRTGLSAAVVVLALALFLQSVHLGYTIRDDEIGAFESRYTGEELQWLMRQRAERWRVRSPMPQRLLAREDQYLSEGLRHVQERNVAWQAGDAFAAWRENLILEKFYGAVLDVRSDATASGHRWPSEQRADAAQRAERDSRPYFSAALPLPLYKWRKPIFWTLVAALMGAIAVPCLVLDWRRRSRPCEDDPWMPNN